MSDRKNFIVLSRDVRKEIEEEIEEGKMVRCVSHLDSDGLSSACILSHALLNKKADFHLSIVKQLSIEVIGALTKEKYETYIFTDLGSGQISQLEERLKGKKVFVLDHHLPEKESEKIRQVNPHFFGIDGEKEISGVGVTYFVIKELLPPENSNEWLVVVGAVGDRQDKGERNSLIGLNREIVRQGEKTRKIKEELDLNLFGRYSRPLHKSLEYTFHPYIPGVSGDETEAVALLKKLGIRLKDEEGNWRRLVDLTAEEKKKLTEEIIRRIAEGETPSKPLDIIATHYINLVEKEERLKDAREFSTILNGCGRLGKPEIGVLLGLSRKREVLEEADKLMVKYRKELAGYLNKLKNSKLVDSRNGIAVIKPQANIKDTMIGTVSSILLTSLKDKGVVIGIAEMNNETYKVSIRAKPELEKLELGKVVREITKKISCFGGGHRKAAGAEIKKEKIGIFLNELMKEINQFQHF